MPRDERRAKSIPRVLFVPALILVYVLGSVAKSAVHGGTEPIDAIIVLAGGVNERGEPHKSVQRRLRRAYKLYSEQHAAGRPPPAILCNGGGTTHKPRWTLDGFAVPEAALMGQRLLAMGVERRHLYLESLSDDTLGNALMARLMHADARSWRRLVLVTSGFHMPRARAIYTWAFGLQPTPAKGHYTLSFEPVDDEGALTAEALRSRRAREESSAAAFLSGPVRALRTLGEAHEWLFLNHSGYSVQGVLAKRKPRKSALDESY